jgi:hypothetical protein
VKFRDTVAKFPVSKIRLGRDVGPAIDIGPTMARNIVKANGQVMYCTSVRSLTPDEIQSPTELKDREAFNAAIEEKYGSPMTEADFKDDPDYAKFLTPTFECYEDGEDKDDGYTYDQYVGAKVRVPIGDEICTVRVIRCKREFNGTVKGRGN